MKTAFPQPWQSPSKAVRASIPAFCLLGVVICALSCSLVLRPDEHKGQADAAADGDPQDGGGDVTADAHDADTFPDGDGDAPQDTDPDQGRDGDQDTETEPLFLISGMSISAYQVDQTQYLLETYAERGSPVVRLRKCTLGASGERRSCEPFQNVDMSATLTTPSLSGTAASLIGQGSLSLVESFFDGDGDAAWSHVCNYSPGGARWADCDAWQGHEVPAMGLPDTSFGGAASFMHTYGGVSYLVQLLYNVPGTTAWWRECVIDGSEVDFNACSGWTDPFDLTNSPPRSPADRYGAYAAYVYNSAAGTRLRQYRIHINGTEGWWAEWPVNASVGVDFSVPPQWQHISAAELLEP